ncbi:XrtA/PEP-CTERM system TPR-repeat protein PrsT [Thalassotalea mangrovi]|uniref:PEP-CTERM system TPR-repeat protein PrsT n=1 Tax=Thalassotalea mangrovi TaxID=2572245 RepID=A0A4U1B7Q9_9GAMM|nr:XrtA/PEP-CTERM system TPR-repeat protein PrsT [Thalassotalea mangrovi]TKB46644.1 PEP-CTERM system TPR-repeat protein PrsT [Thalassotalea mangrovi]
MKTTINSLIILFLSFLALTACQPDKSEQEYIDSALLLMADGDYQAASIELKNAVRVAPQSGRSRMLLGKSYLLSGSIQGAKKELQRALDLNFDADIVLPLLVRSNIYMLDFDSVKDNIDTAIQLSPQVQREINSVAGIAMSMAGDVESGFDVLSKVITGKPSDDFYYKLSQAWFAAHNDQITQAIDMVDALQVQDTPYRDATLMLANLYRMNRQFDMAVQAYANYNKAYAYNYLAQLAYINVLIREGQMDVAEEQVDEMLGYYPSSAIVNEYKAELLTLSGKNAEAIEHATLALSGQPNLVKSNLIAGVANYRLGNFESSYRHLSIIEKDLPSKHVGHKILSMVKLKLGYIDEAVASIEKLDEINAEDFALVANTSQALLRKGDTSQASKYIEKLDALDVNDSQTLGQRGALKLSVQDDTGIDDLKRALELDPDFDRARLTLLLNYVKTKNYSDAMGIADEWVKQKPDSDQGYLARGVVYRAQGEMKQAINAFNVALEKVENSSGALFNLALADMQDGQGEQAHQKLTRLLQNEPAHRGGLDLIIANAKNLNDEDEVVDFLEELSEQHPEQVNLTIARAKALENAGRRGQGLELLQSMASNKDNPDVYYRVFAKMAIAAKQYQRAENLYLTQIEKNPDNFDAHQGYLYTLEVQQKYQQAYTQVKKAQQRFPEQENLKLVEANYLMQSKSYGRARAVIESIDPSEVNEIGYLKLAAKFYYQVNENEQAKEFAQPLHQRQPNAANSFLYAQILQRLRDNNTALDVINVGLASDPDNLAMKNLKAELTSETDPQQALALYQEIAEKYPDSFVVLNNLAWSAIMAEQYQLGLDSAKRAAKLAPQQPQVKDTLAVAHMKMGDYDTAESLLIEAKQALPDNEEILLHYAEVLIHLNRLTESEEVLASLQTSDKKEKVLQLLENKS